MTAQGGGSARLRPTAGYDLRLQTLQAFLSLVPDATIIVDGDGKIVSANEQAERLFDYDSAGLIGQPVELLVPERFRHAHLAHRAAYLLAARARPMGVGLELAGRRRDGTEFPVGISLAPIADVEPALTVAAVRDVSERQAANATRAQLAAIVESSTDGIVAMTADGRITAWNGGAEALFGYSGLDMIGQHISLLVPEDSAAELEGLLATALEGDVRAAFDTQWLHRDGRRLDIALVVLPMTGGGGRHSGFSVVVRDIGERKQAEAELHRALALERRLKRQQKATAEIRLGLLSGSPADEALGLTCERACELLDAGAATLSLVENGELRVVAAAAGGGHLVGSAMSLEGSLAGSAIAAGAAQRVDRVEDDPLADSRITGLPSGPALGVPIAWDGSTSGALVITRAPGSPRFDDDDVEFGVAMAHQAALALELRRAHDDRDRILLVEDRERIGRELHDVVVRRLFSIGLALEGIASLVHDGEVGGRLARAVAELDVTIHEIRSTVFAIDRRRPSSPA